MTLENIQLPRILVVAENPLSRAGLVALLTEQSDYHVVGQTSSGQMSTALELYQPDIIVWDLGWNATDPIDRLAEVRETETAVVVLLADEEIAADVWSYGIQGILPQQIETRDLIAALNAVERGLMVIHPRLASMLISPKTDLVNEPIPLMTPRELEVLQLLAQGLTNKGIAHTLGISEHTIKFHVNGIMTKLNAQSRTEAVVHATRLGLIIL